MGYGYGHMDSGWGAVMLLVMLAFLTLVVLGVVWFVRATTAPPLGGAPPAPMTAGAEQVLAERLARGEIEPEDYQARLKALRAAR